MDAQVNDKEKYTEEKNADKDTVKDKVKDTKEYSENDMENCTWHDPEEIHMEEKSTEDDTEKDTEMDAEDKGTIGTSEFGSIDQDSNVSEDAHDADQHAELEQEECQKGPTTVMLCNLACRYLQEDLAVLLNEAGLQGLYHWIYVPSNTTRRGGGKAKGKGYAFVDFKDPSCVDLCRQLLEGRKLGDTQTNKVIQVKLATKSTIPASALIDVCLEPGDHTNLTEQGPLESDADRARSKRQQRKLRSDPSKAAADPSHADSNTRAGGLGDILAQWGQPHAQKPELHEEANTNGFTVIVRGIPSRWMQHHLASMLDQVGLGDTYNGVTVPLRRRGARPTNKGYGFITFIDYFYVEECQRLMSIALPALQKQITVELAKGQDWVATVAQETAPAVVADGFERCVLSV